jgi:RecA/RadA recombinase
MASLFDRLKKSGQLSAQLATNAEEIRYGDGTPSPVRALNIAQRGSLFQGPVKGIKQICGESGTFKTMIALMEAKAYLDFWLEKGEDPFILFYSNEHGATIDYFNNLGIDPNRVIYVSFKGIEDLSHDMIQKFADLKKGDKIFTVVDSLGMAGSKKETDDLIAGNDKQDMTRAKKINSFVRVFCPMVIPLELSVVFINHVYQDQTAKYNKPIVSGGQKLYLASNEVWIVSKRQLKEGDEKVGNEFVITIDKSRFVKPLERIPICVSYEKGVYRYGGLTEIGIDSGHIVKHTGGWFSRAKIDRNKTPKGPKSKIKESDYWTKFRRNDISDNEEFWAPVLANQEFSRYIENRFRLNGDLCAAQKIKDEALSELDPELQLDQQSNIEIVEGEGDE